jgi:hypothetical protein
MAMNWFAQIYFSYENWRGSSPQLCGLGMGSSPWTSGGGRTRSRRCTTEMALWLTGPLRKELGSKGEMRGTHSRGLRGVGDAGKGRLVAASRETMMMRALGGGGEAGL